MYTSPSDSWQLITLPVLPRAIDNTVESVFADDIAADYDVRWVLYAFDATAGVYQKLDLNSPLLSGQGYWIVQITGTE